MKNSSQIRCARVYANGCCLDMGFHVSKEESFSDDTCEVRRGGGKRGRLRGKYSSASFRRLREFCVTHECEGDCWGVTLTIPSNVLHFFWVRDYVHRLSVWCNYHGLPMIWRCELQQRGQAHLHLVCYGSVDDVLLMMLQWQNLLMKSGKCLSKERVSKGVYELVWINRMFVTGAHHAFYLEKLEGDFRSWRYLVAHQSKGKLAQEGWLGRQWGVVNRHAMTVDKGFEYSLDDKRAYTLRRWVRRLCRRRINNFGKHFLLMNPDTMKRMVSHLQDDYFSVPF